jgi:CRP-like cAMP-binding protein
MATRRPKSDPVRLHLVRDESLSGKSQAGAAIPGKAPGRAIEPRRSMPAACHLCDARQHCPLSHAHWLRPLLSTRIYGRNTILVRQGEPVKFIQLLRRGLVQATHVMPNGKSISELFGPGSVIGISTAITRETLPYTAMALDECEIEQAEVAPVLRHLRNDPGTTMDLLRYACWQAHRLLEVFYKTAAKMPSDERLLEVLHEIAAACGVPGKGGTRINMPLPVQALADRISCSRQWASKQLAELVRRGAIRRNGPWITLVKPPRS